MIRLSSIRSLGAVYLIFGLAILIHAGLWMVTCKIQPRWPNVPPAPSVRTAASLGLGDSQFAYRTMAYQLQVMGNEGGLFTPLYNYDFNRLGRWFDVLHEIDSDSDYVPYLAAYYFGATQRPEQQLRPVIDYLARAGHVNKEGKWRWLTQAVYLAYYRHKNKELALVLADQLSELPILSLPHWARQMRAILTAVDGDRVTALTLMREILLATLKEKGDKVDSVEVNFMVDFICHRYQTPAQAARDPICLLNDKSAEKTKLQ